MASKTVIRPIRKILKQIPSIRRSRSIAATGTSENQAILWPPQANNIRLRKLLPLTGNENNLTVSKKNQKNIFFLADEKNVCAKTLTFAQTAHLGYSTARKICFRNLNLPFLAVLVNSFPLTNFVAFASLFSFLMLYAHNLKPKQVNPETFI